MIRLSSFKTFFPLEAKKQCAIEDVSSNQNLASLVEYVPIADQLFDDHLKQIERDEKKREEKKRGKEFP